MRNLLIILFVLNSIFAFSQDGSWPGLDVGTLAIPSTTNYTGSTSSASDNCSSSSGVDHMYNFTISSTATVTIDLCGSDYDTKLYVYSISESCGGTSVGYNDDDCGLQSSVTLTSLAAGNYVIVVEGFSGATGNYDLTIDISAPPAPTIHDCLGAQPACFDSFDEDSPLYGTNSGQGNYLNEIYDQGVKDWHTQDDQPGILY